MLHPDRIPVAVTVARGRAAAAGLDLSVRFAAAAALLVTIASWFGSHYWLLELLTHFRVQYLAGAVALAAVAAFRKCRVGLLLALVVAAANLLPVWSYIVPGVRDVQALQPATRLMSVNVQYHNANHDAVLALVRGENPDIAGFQEVNAAWAEALDELRETYPYSILRPQEGAYGLALFSRLPLHELNESPYVENDVQSAIMVDVTLQQHKARLILAHLKAPTSARKSALRNAQLAAITDMIAETTAGDRGREHILLGDLNITPWSPWYALLESETGLVNAARTRGYWPTWPAGSPLKIPIDHCLVSDGLQVHRYRTGPNVGSDHLPVIVDIAFADIPLAEIP